MRWVKMPFVFVGLLCVAFWDLVRGNPGPRTSEPLDSDAVYPEQRSDLPWWP